jgi:hypothetical protein
MGISTPNTARGTVPDRLLVVTRQEEEEVQVIDGKEYSTKVRPAFFTDADGKTDTAINWGTTLQPTGKRVKVEYGNLPYKNGKKQFYWADEHERVPPETETILNSGFTNVRIWTIDSRMEGGRAYKCIDEEGRYFDIREDLLLEAMYNGEVKQTKNGIVLTGTYVWVRAHSQMRVARVGSVVHKELLEAKQRKAMKKITGKQQVIGGVYRKTDGNMYVYVGRDRQRGKLYWSYVQLREPYQGFNEAQIAIHEKWEAMTLQEKFDYEVETRKISGCAETRSTAMVVIEHVADIDMRGGTAQTLQWHPTQIIKGKVVRV